MIRDTWTVMRKDLCELRPLHRPGFTLYLALAVLSLFGLLIPFFLAQALAVRYLAMLALWLPWLLAAGVVSDAFAGERERHTLDTLFVTPLPGPAILLGKIGAVSLYSLTLTVFTLLLASASLAPILGPTMLAAGRILELAAAAAISAVVAATAGALCSLRSSAMGQARRLSIAAALVLAALLILARYAVQVSPLRLSAEPAIALALLVLIAAEPVLFTLAAKSIDRCRFGRG